MSVYICNIFLYKINLYYIIKSICTRGVQYFSLWICKKSKIPLNRTVQIKNFQRWMDEIKLLYHVSYSPHSNQSPAPLFKIVSLIALSLSKIASLSLPPQNHTTTPLLYAVSPLWPPYFEPNPIFVLRFWPPSFLFIPSPLTTTALP
jgi:hypothetical protein